MTYRWINDEARSPSSPPFLEVQYVVKSLANLAIEMVKRHSYTGVFARVLVSDVPVGTIAAMPMQLTNIA